VYVGKSGHRVKPAAADDANLRLSQSPLLHHPSDEDLSLGTPVFITRRFPARIFAACKHLSIKEALNFSLANTPVKLLTGHYEMRR
jgi:hypothetical protein